VMHENVTHNRRYAKFRDFAEAVLGFLRKTVPRRFNEFSSSITDNFRVIDPKDFRILAWHRYIYQTNVADYPSWQAWLKDRRPPLLMLWGRYDPSFALAEAQAYRRDVPDAEVHILDAGHFALDEKVDEAATLIRDFLAKRMI
jgi:pimeloyl-ACP methyl ester carboxylesterase